MKRTPTANRNLVNYADALKASVLADLRGAQPAEVVSYNAAEQTVSVRFPVPRAVRQLTEEGEEETTWQAQPGVDDVPVCFLGSEDGGLTFPVGEGTQGVFLVFEADPGGYLNTGAAPAELGMVERHTLGCGGVFVPMAVAFGTNAPAAPGATVVHGDDVRLAEATATQAMARADRAEAQLLALAERVWFLESWCNQLASYLGQINPALITLTGIPALLPPQWTLINPTPGRPVSNWTGWAGLPRPWAPAQGDLPAGYFGTGNVGADKVKGV